MTLTEFLLARIAEDEAVAGSIHKAMCDLVTQAPRWECSCGRPARVLAECEAKRRIVEGLRPYGELDDLYAPELLAILALPYADHEDFREEWRA